MTDAVAVEVVGLSKSYGATVAARDVSFAVRRGEIFGVLGPNGAGKTTVTECLAALRRADRGRIRVLGLDPACHPYPLRRRVGVQLQRAALPDRIKLREALRLFSALYEQPLDWRDLLTRLGLDDSVDAAFGTLSGGQKQRAFIALALLNRPEVVFLDELTASLDPRARHAMWDVVRDVRDRGATVFLTTHCMEEAERLCDRVAIMSRGRVIALDAPAALIGASGGARRVVFTATEPFDVDRLRRIAGVERAERAGERVVVRGRGDDLVGDVVGALAETGIRCRDLHTERTTLEDVFLALTGDTLADG